MISIPGYTLTEKIHESHNVVVYSGFTDSDNQKKPYLFKILKKESLSPEDTAKVKLELDKIKNIKSDNIITVHDIIDTDEGIIVILEDFHGVPLKVFKGKKPFDLKTSISIAVQIANALGDIHRYDIIHRDIRPHTIFIDRESDTARIGDFGVLSKITERNKSFYDKEVIEKKLPYISPEQTGRMNRTIDYRTDFYSLGITLYEMLTNRLPFQSDDPMELIHSHIAKMPVNPSEINIGVPLVISDIVMKLLSKNAEERYQSGYGLKTDLMECLEQLEKTGKIETFKLRQRDISDRFQIPQKLYGREKEIQALMTAFDRVSAGRTEIMLVSGHPGIGKTALVHEIHKPIVRQKGYFIMGKYDKLRREVPYSALIQAFKGLIRQILTESEERIQRWRDEIQKAVGPSGQIITDVILEVETIIGKQPSVPLLGPTESQNRFNRVFQKFVSVFIKMEHPLVIFLDDLQWVDLASLNLIKILVTDHQMKYLFIIGAYRNNEVTRSHPFILAVDDLKKADVIINSIELPPLQENHINQLIADALNCTLEKAGPLAKLIYLKTEGNPFFVNQFLKALYRENMLVFDLTVGWYWNTEKIKQLGVTENVVVLMVRRINMLPSKTQEVLKLASCFGNRFELETMSLLYGKPIIDTYIDLDEAIKGGFVLLSDGKYRFLHDRIHEAVYSLISDKDKEHLHHKIGKSELKRIKGEELHEKIFYIADQLNFGRGLITDLSEREEIARLNLMAGRKAKSSAAYASAVQYFSTGAEFLSENSWQSQYDLTYQFHMERAECEYLSGNFDNAEKILTVVHDNAHTVEEKAQVFNLKTVMYRHLDRMADAANAGLEGLRLLGVHIPENPGKAKVSIEFMKAFLLLRGRKPKDLLELTETTEQKWRLAMNLLTNTGTAVYFLYNQNLFALVCLRGFCLTLQHGLTDISPFMVFAFGIALADTLGAYKTGYDFGKLAIALNERMPNAQIRCKVYSLFGFFISHWREPYKKGVDIVKTAFNYDIEAGDYTYAGYSAGTLFLYLLVQGRNIDEHLAETKTYLDFFVRVGEQFSIDVQMLQCQFLYNLKGMTKDRLSLGDNTFDENRALKSYIERNNGNLLFQYYFFKGVLYFLHDEFAEAGRFFKQGQQYSQAVALLPVVSEHNFYYSLAVAAVYPASKASDRRQSYRQLRKNQKRMKKWVDNCPENFLHKYLLIEAEIARISGKNQEAMELYDRAIASAGENKYLQSEAIANELASKFYITKGNKSIAMTYMTKARSCYNRWGATAIVKLLDEKYPQLLGNIPEESIAPTEERKLSTATSLSSALDLATILKSSQAISEEISLNKLLDKLMRIVIENAGAQRGFLILEKDARLFIEAEGSIDKDEVTILLSVPVESSNDLSPGIIQYVKRVREDVVLNDAANEGLFTSDSYVVKNKPKSILCSPIIRQNKLIGILYLENNLITNAFTPERLEILNILSSQAAISLENAMLYDELELRVHERTAELIKANEQLRNEITEREKVEDQLAQRAFYDSLTNLPNRALFMERINSLFERKKRYKDYLFAVFFMDVDRFKIINDNFGHMAGDQLLIMLAQRLKNAIRSVDTVARFGGDEFAILLDDIKEVRNVDFVVKRIHNELKQPVNLFGQEVFITLSIGITTSETSLYSNPEDLLRDADIAMYNAKTRGRACHVVFNSAMHTEVVTTLKTESELRMALEKNEFTLYYQPIMSLKTNKITGFEALLRWQHPERGLLAPADFILIAEQTDLIIQIGKWVLREACRQMYEWQKRFPEYRDATISVNLSSREFSQPNFVELVEKTLSETGLNGSSLNLEITERMIIDNPESASAVLQKLKHLNVQFNIDDFGTGHSALGYLRYFPINALKIDQTFINTLAADKYNTEIVKTIIALAHNLNMDVIAEGIETEEQVALFKEMKGEYVQGFLYHKPIDSRAVEALLTSQ